jgi:hypothetical protein
MVPLETEVTSWPQSANPPRGPLGGPPTPPGHWLLQGYDGLHRLQGL